MRKAFKYFILTSLVFSTTCISYTYAQEISNANEEDCAVTLRKSQKLYEDGLIEQVPINILSCLENGGFTNEDKSSAIRLMIYAYLFDDKKVKAEEYMIKLLKLDPELQINEAVDPQEFIQLYNSFRTSPTYSFNFSIGSNLTFVSLMTQYGVHDVNNQQPLYSTELGFNVGVGVNRNLFKNAAISLDFIYTQFKTQYTAVQLDIFNVSYQEDLAFVTAPLSFKYSLNNRKSPLFPHFRIGGTVGYLFDSESELTREYIDGSKVPVEGPKVSLLDSRNQLVFWAMAGAGINYKVKKGNVFLDLRYNYGFQNIVKTEQRYQNDLNNDLLYRYYYLDDDFKLNNFAFTIGYAYNIYKPVKKGN